AEAVEAAGVRVTGPRREIPRGASATRYAFPVARSAWRFFKRLRSDRPDIVHFFLPGPYLLGAPLALLCGVPVRIMSRRSMNIYQQKHPFMRRLERYLHRRMTAVIGNS